MNSFAIKAIKLILICFSFSSCVVNESLNIKAETNYSKSDSERMTTKVSADFKHKILQMNNGKHHLYFFGNVSPDYDHFGKIIKVNGFNGLSFEF
jgi:hypothetical protein